MSTISQIERAEEELFQSMDYDVPEDTGWSIKQAAGGDPGEAAVIADRLVAKIAGQRGALAAHRYAAERQIEHVQQWLAAQEKKAEKRLLRLQMALRTYYHDFPPEKGKTLSLPSGKLSTRKNPPLTEKNEQAARVFITQLGLEGMQYWRDQEPPIDWKALNADIEYTTDGEAVYKPTGEMMKVALEREDGEMAEVLVKRRMPPPEPETFTVETNGGGI